MTQLTPALEKKLIDAATAVRANAYAPYSDYAVGAAVLAADGTIFSGVNVENASYGLTICAERNAIAQMVAAGQRRAAAIAICGKPGVTPCGACRQVLVEFAGDIPVFLCDTEGEVRRTTLHALLPDHFSPGHLPRG